MTDSMDDLGTAKAPFRVIACLPVHGRLPLLKLTIERLYRVNGCYKVICAGDGLEEKKLCESLGAVWVPHQNQPLGAKWNAAFMKAKEFNPDAVVYVGSSDWLVSSWFSIMEPIIKEKHFVGPAGCYFLDIGEERRAVWWAGYKTSRFHQNRADETIGIGRMLSRELMDKIGWKPFDDTFDNSLDRSMKERCRKVGVDDYMMDIKGALSISTNRWMNKHKFEHHYGNALPSERLDPNYLCSLFPEALTL